MHEVESIARAGGNVQKSSSSKAEAILTRGAYIEYVSTAKWRERRWRLFPTFPCGLCLACFRSGVLILLVFLMGCAGMFQGPVRPVAESQSQQVLEALRQKESAIRTLRGLFEASISGSGIPFSQRLNGLFSYARPDRLHLKGFLRVGVPVMDFHREGNAYELFFPAENKLVAGRMDQVQEPTSWDQTIQLSIRALDAVLGKIAGLSSSDVQVLKNDTHYRIDMVLAPTNGRPTPEGFTVHTWVNAQTLEVASIEYRRSFDDIVVSVECEDYRGVRMKSSANGSMVRLPFLVRATDHRPTGGSITLNFQEFIVNAA